MQGPRDNLAGAAFMVVSMAAFVLNDTAMKLVAPDMGLFQAMWLRGLAATALIAALALVTGAFRHRIRRADRGPLALRLAGEIGGTVCFLSALFAMPLANAMAILQTMPLAVTLAAALVLGERVGWRRGLAIAVGFAGVLLIVRPGTEGFDANALWALAAVGFMVLRDLATRQLAPGIPSVLVAAMTAAAITAVGGAVSLTRPWAPTEPWHLGTLAGGAVFLVVGYLFNVKAMRAGEIGFVSPFRYTVLVWALILGWAVFGDVPAAATLAGGAIVVAAGVYTLLRERRLARAAAIRPVAAGPQPPVASSP